VTDENVTETPTEFPKPTKAIFVNAAEGTSYGIVPYMIPQHLAIVSAVVGAGGRRTYHFGKTKSQKFQHYLFASPFIQTTQYELLNRRRCIWMCDCIGWDCIGKKLLNP
jgi:hypothetical protein